VFTRVFFCRLVVRNSNLLIETMTSNFPASGGSGKKNKGKLQQVAKVTLQDDHDDEEDNGEEEEEDDDDQDGPELSKAVIRRVIALRKSHDEMEALDKEYKRERIELEKKYLARRTPFFELRSRIVTGEFDPPITEEEGSAPEEASTEADEKGIHGFWLQCLSAKSSVGYLITPEDEPALEALSDIKCEYDEEFTSFTLYFYFQENEFFTNTVLTKKYGVSPDLLDDKSPALTLNEGTEINWKPSKNLCVTEIMKKQKAKGGKNKGQTRTVKTTVPKRSFFQYFSTPKPEDEEDEAEGEEDEEGRVTLTMEEDYDVGHTIRTSIIPEAILWFTGDAVDDDDYEDGDEDDEDEEDDDEEEEEEEPVAAPARGGKGGKKNKGGFAEQAGGAAGAGGEQPECKQN